MKFQKWHFGLISIIVIVLALIWASNYYQSSKNNYTSAEKNQESSAATNSDSKDNSTAIDESKPLFFYSDYCPHCQKMKPIVEKLQSQGYQIEWVDANARQNEKLNYKYQITGVPTFVRPDGQKLIGEQDEQTLADFLKDYKK